MESIEVEEKFTIDGDWENEHVNCEGETYKLKKKHLGEKGT